MGEKLENNPLFLFNILMKSETIQQIFNLMQKQNSNSEESIHSQSGSQNDKNSTSRRSRKQNPKKDRDADEEDESQQMESQERDIEENLNSGNGRQRGKAMRVLAERVRKITQETEYLCRIQGKSYLHLQWLTKKKIKQQGLRMIQSNKRNQQSQEEKLQQIQRKFGKNCYFNPAFTKVDRILTAAVIFPFMHQKKGNQIAGKWSQSLMLVCAKMLNFQQDHIPYGVEHKDFYDDEEESDQKNMKLEYVINKIYLDRYLNSHQVWKQIGMSINNVQKLNEGGSLVIRECAVFLYWQWYCLSLQRYLSFNKKSHQKKPSVPKMNFQLRNGEIKLDMFIKKNIFTGQKKGQPPANTQELQILNPGSFTYKWLNQKEDYCNFRFEQLQSEDFDKLDLNTEIDNLFLIKWCQLDYEQVSWQKESEISCPEKIAQFKAFNKLPNKKIRQRFEQNRALQKKLLTHYCPSRRDKKLPEEDLRKYKKKLFCYHSVNKQPKQYNEKDRPIYKDYKVLKAFQLESLNWMIKCWSEKRNCILADEMGLGKTVQTIAFLNHLYTFQNVIGPFLIIAPVSTLKQWRMQIQSWSDFNCILYKGRPSSRALIQQYQFYHNFVTNDGIIIKYQKIPKFQIFLTNSEIFITDFDLIKKIAFQHVIIDEAHRIKNRHSKLTKAITHLPCSRYLLLTGTPIQNNPSELWSLLNLIEPCTFPKFQEFKNQFGTLKNSQDLEKFKEVLKPYLLRRVKSDVEKSIPKLEELIVDLDLTNTQKTYYRGILQQNKNKIINSLSTVSINNLSVCLRQCCDHPFMLGHEIQDEIYRPCRSGEQRMEKMIESSIKMVFIHKILQKCSKNKTKTLIFTQFLAMIKILAMYCEYHGIDYESLDGKIKYEQRQSRIDRFNKDPNVLAFIISTKAGGMGINLTSATNIIIYDSDWNPQNDIQAIARAHRIGQKKNVTVYRLITSNTYEAQLFQCALKKLSLGLAILDNDFFTNNSEKSRSEKTTQELQKLLKTGVLGFLKNQGNSKEGNTIENCSIEEILEKTTRTVEYSSRQCSFSKTKVASTNSNEQSISLDDPNFWEVALQNIETPLQILTKKLDKSRAKNYSSISEQEKLMIEANEVVSDFVKEKISMTKFNAQDERQLKKFLQIISSSRQFHRKYRNISDEWLEQIEKPSRRYNKLQPSQFKVSVPQKQPETRLKKMKEKVENNENIEQKNQPQGERRKRRVQKVDYKEKQAKIPNENAYLLQFLCTLCERKKCSKYCNKMCKRMFHKQCYENYKNGEAPPKEEDIEEFNDSKEKVLSSLLNKFQCVECAGGQAKCFICNRLDDVVVFDRNAQKQRKDRSRLTTDQSKQNDIQKIIQNTKQKNLSKVYGCRQIECNKFYHLQCLSQLKEALIFQIAQYEDKKIELKCPVHFCAHCKERLSIGSISSCIRCPTSYHRKKCRPLKEDSIEKITNDFFICRYHISQDPDSQGEQNEKKNGDDEKQNLEEGELNKDQNQCVQEFSGQKSRKIRCTMNQQ